MLAFLLYVVLSLAEDPFKLSGYELPEHMPDNLVALLETPEYNPIPRKEWGTKDVNWYQIFLVFFSILVAVTWVLIFYVVYSRRHNILPKPKKGKRGHDEDGMASFISTSELERMDTIPEEDLECPYSDEMHCSSPIISKESPYIISQENPILSQESMDSLN